MQIVLIKIILIAHLVLSLISGHSGWSSIFVLNLYDILRHLRVTSENHPSIYEYSISFKTF